MIGTDVQRFHLRTATSTVLEVTEHHELAHPDDNPAEVGHQDVTAVHHLDPREG